VPAYDGAHTLHVAAPPQACFDALTDYERIPSWQHALRRCEVVERDGEGRGREVLYEVDAKVRTVRYRLRHEYDAPHRITSAYAGGDFRSMAGEYLLAAGRDGGTEVTFRLTIDPGRWIPGPVKRMLQDQVLRRSVEDLKAHVEARA